MLSSLLLVSCRPIALPPIPAGFDRRPDIPRHRTPFLLSASSCTRSAMRNASVSGLLDRKTLVLAESTSGKGVPETAPDTMMTCTGGPPATLGDLETARCGYGQGSGNGVRPGRARGRS